MIDVVKIVRETSRSGAMEKYGHGVFLLACEGCSVGCVRLVIEGEGLDLYMFTLCCLEANWVDLCRFARTPDRHHSTA